jgi:hypothetical protein
MGKTLGWFGVALLATGLTVGCAASDVDIANDEDDGGGNGGSGTGGSSTGGDNTGAGNTNPCGQDCSKIATPQCFVGECNTGQHPGPVNSCVVVPAAVGGACDDGLFCTVTDTCDGTGVCVGSGTNDCGLSPPECQQVVCNEAAKSCSTQNIPAGGACMTSNLCVVGATCDAFGNCSGTPKDCFFAPVPNECHVATCNPANGMCEPQPGNNGQGCVDQSDLCSVNNTCSGGVCGGGVPKNCSALSVGCNNGVCNTTTGVCEAQPIAPGSQCLEATNDCNQGICNTTGVCVANPINEGGACDDGLSCTANTTCTAGTCGGGTSTITTYLVESFASNAAGWTMDTTWQIGPAVFYAGGGACGNGDPANDHTPTSDNGIAGAVIGGDVGTALTNGYRYLTSPIINTSSAPTVWLQYWRFLNSDYTRFMNNVVEVYNGSSWVQIWQSGPPPAVQDNAWVSMSHDITAYKNSQMRVRFGYNIDSSGVYSNCGGWNLDDVLVATGTCN